MALMLWLMIIQSSLIESIFTWTSLSRLPGVPTRQVASASCFTSRNNLKISKQFLYDIPERS
jgi:hypothetical protein